MKIWIIFVIILIQLVIIKSSSPIILDESSHPVIINYSSNYLINLITKNNKAYISRIDLSRKTQFIKYAPLNIAYSYEVISALTSNNDIVIVYGNTPTICLIDHVDNKKVSISRLEGYDYDSTNLSYNLMTFKNEENPNDDIIIIGWISEDSYYLLLIYQQSLKVHFEIKKSLKLQVFNCISTEGRVFMCCFIHNSNFIIQLYDIDQDDIEIEEEEENEVKTTINAKDASSFIYGKLIHMKDNNYIGCYWSNSGSYFCILIENSIEKESINVVQQTDTFIAQCSQLNYKTMSIAKITNSKFIISCKKDSQMIYQTSDMNLKSPSPIISEEIGDFQFMNVISNQETSSIFFLYSVKENIYLKTLTIPQCIDIIQPINDLNSHQISISSFIFKKNTGNTTSIVFTYIPSDISIFINDTKVNAIQQNQLYLLDTIKYIKCIHPKRNIENVTYHLIDDLRIESNTCSLMIINCYETCLTCNIKGSLTNHKCTSCIENHYFLEGTNNCYSIHDPPDNYYFNSLTSFFEQCYDSCEQCSNKGTSINHNCLSCKDNYYPIDESPGNCYYYLESITHYYFDELLEMFKRCSIECKNCFDKPHEEDTNCIECSKGFISHPNDNSICVKDCLPYTWYIDIVTWEYKCTNSTDSCPNKDYPILKSSTKECSKYCQRNEQYQYQYQYNNNCIKQCPDNTYIDKLYRKCYDIPDKISLNQMKEMILALPIQEHLQGDNFTFLIYKTSINNADFIRDSISNNLSFIEFEDCNNVLRTVWNIPRDQFLFVSKIEVNKNDTTNSIKYKIFKETGEELDLSACENLNVKKNYELKKTPDELSIPLAKILKERGVDIYDLNDSFFNSICINFSSENDRDVIIMDRRADYFKNVSFCEENCTYLKVHLDSLIVECACAVNNNTDDLIFVPNKFQQDFDNEFVSSNYRVIVCYNLVFDAKLLRNNIGNYFIIVLFIIHIVINIYYIITGMRPVIKQINKLLKACPPKIRTNLRLTSENNNKNLLTQSSVNISNIDKTKRERERERKSEKEQDEVLKIEMSFNQRQNYPSQKETNIKESIEVTNQLINQPQTIIFHNNWINDEDRRSKKTTKEYYISKKKITQPLYFLTTQSEVIKYDINDYEDMKYEEAVNADNRSFLSIYYQMIKSKQILLCLILNKQLLFKYLFFSVFLLGTATDFFFNAFFFTDDYIHKGYVLDEGLTFWVTLPKSILSFVLTSLLIYLLEFLTSSKVKITMKRGKKKIDYYRECNVLIKVIRFKLRFYFVIGFFAYALYWYYIAAFCAVFQNSQSNWIESSFVSFSFSMLMPFITCLIAGLLRFSGIKYKSQYVYIYKYNLILYLFRFCFKFSNLILIFI